MATPRWEECFLNEWQPVGLKRVGLIQVIDSHKAEANNCAIKAMKLSMTFFKFFSAVAILTLAVGCSTTRHTEQMLSAAGFKKINPKTPQQEQQIKTLPPDKLTVAKRNGKIYYVFPDPSHNQLYVGTLEQYQNYQQILSDYKISVQNRVDADMAGADGDNDENRWAVWTENSGWVTGSSY
jgi:hypothetical protein